MATKKASKFIIEKTITGSTKEELIRAFEKEINKMPAFIKSSGVLIAGIFTVSILEE